MSPEPRDRPPAPLRIAFVCLGNICRSPIAEVVARSLIDKAGLSGRVTVESYGTAGYHAGEPADRQAAAALARRGWSADGHRARQLTPAALAGLDLVLCADTANLAEVRRMAGAGSDPARIRLLRSFDPGAPPGAAVPDPWGLDDDAFDRVVDMVEVACRGLVDSLPASTD